jgi:hypothetical protein
VVKEIKQFAEARQTRFDKRKGKLQEIRILLNTSDVKLTNADKFYQATNICTFVRSTNTLKDR